MEMKYVFTLDGAFGRSSRLIFESASTTNQRCYGFVIDNEKITVYGCGRTFATDQPVSWEVVITGDEARAVRDDGREVSILPRPGSAVIYDNGVSRHEFIFTGGLLIPRVEED